ncbi:HNH endonuclease, partial [Gordonia sp. DT219]
DYAKGGLTNIDDLAPACPKHNRMVGEKLGQYTTGIYRDGPLAGRCWWRRNAAPGAPPHPKRVNKLPDVGPDFTAGLARVRAEIHRQPPDPPDTGKPLPDSSTGTFTDPITADRSCLVGLAPGEKIVRTTVGTATGSYDIVEIITHDDDALDPADR